MNGKFYWFGFLFYKNKEFFFFLENLILFQKEIFEIVMEMNLFIVCVEKGKCGSDVGFRICIGVVFMDKG